MTNNYEKLLEQRKNKKLDEFNEDWRDKEEEEKNVQKNKTID